MSTKFGDRVMQARKEKGLSRDELAKMIGTSGPIVGRYERGNMMPSVEIATKIAEALDVSLDYLVGSAEQKIDKITLNRIQEINKLKEADKNLVYAFLDAFITKSKLQAVL